MRVPGREMNQTKREVMTVWLEEHPGRSERDWLLEVRCVSDEQRKELKALFERVAATPHCELEVCPLEEYVSVNGVHVIYPTDKLPETESKLVDYDFRVNGFLYDLDTPEDVYVVADLKRHGVATWNFFRWKGRQIGVDSESFAKWAWHDNIPMQSDYKHWRDLLKR